MNVSTVRTVPDSEKPTCIGKLWDPNTSECSGGRDPSYVHPKNGSHVREKCDFFNECGARVQAHQYIPTQNLIRTQQPPVQTSQAPTSSFKEYMERRAVADAVEAERARIAAAAIQQQRVAS